jgi:hypothetical protein
MKSKLVLSFEKFIIHYLSNTSMKGSVTYVREIFCRRVTYRPIDKQRLGKHIPAEANARHNRTSIARQRISKHA